MSKHNKFSFIHDQFTRMFSDKFMLCNSIRSYFDNCGEETNNICFVANYQIRLPACIL